MTGDVTINPSATCLVMTTEVRPSGLVSYRMLTCRRTDSAVYALSRVRNHARSRMGHLRRDSLHARQGAWCGLGGNHHPFAAHGALRLPVRDHPECNAVRRVDMQVTRATVSRRIHRLPADAAAALPVPGGWRGHLSRREREGRVQGGQLQQGDGHAAGEAGRRPRGSEEWEGAEGKVQEGWREKRYVCTELHSTHADAFQALPTYRKLSR